MIAAAVIATVLSHAAHSLPPCRFVANPLRAGSIVAPADTIEGACSPGSVRRKLRYDPVVRVARAAVDLAPGDELGRVLVPERPPVLAGDRLAVAARIGPVTVSREVMALQAGSTGRWLFVRDDHGKVFRVPMPAPLSAEGTVP